MALDKSTRQLILDNSTMNPDAHMSLDNSSISNDAYNSTMKYDTHKWH